VDLSDEIVMEALAKGCSALEAARTAGVPVARVYELIRDPEFRAALTGESQRTLRRAVDLLLAEVDATIAVLRDLRDSSSDTVRLRAASKMVDLLTVLHARLHLLPRLESIEDQVCGRGGN
jgi:hypothetical protein